MYGFVTTSGTRYDVCNGRITRRGSMDVVNRPGSIDKAPLRQVAALPVVGRRFVFRLVGDNAPITTAPVARVF